MANTEDPVRFAKEGDVNYFEEVELDVLLNSRSKLGGSVLCVAAAYGHLKCCQVIYKRCPQLLYQANNQGCTPLHEAAYFGENDVIKFLLCARGIAELQEGATQLENGTGGIDETIVDYELLLMMDHDKETALHAATENGYLQSVNLLLEANPNNDLLRMVNGEGETALHIAVKNQDFDIVQLLVEIDTENIYPPDKSGHTPLSIALKEALSGDQTAALTPQPAAIAAQDLEETTISPITRRPPIHRFLSSPAARSGEDLVRYRLSRSGTAAQSRSRSFLCRSINLLFLARLTATPPTAHRSFSEKILQGTSAVFLVWFA